MDFLHGAEKLPAALSGFFALHKNNIKTQYRRSSASERVYTPRDTGMVTLWFTGFMFGGTVSEGAR